MTWQPDTLAEPILLGDCPIVVRNADDARRAAEWVEAEFWKKFQHQPLPPPPRDEEAGG